MPTVTGADIVAAVKQDLGDPYVYGATGPHAFDCSGLVQYTLTHLGIKDVPRTSEAQWAWVKRIPKSKLAPGDLVFAQFPGDNASPGHVGVYIGGGQVLSAEDPAHGVALSSLASWGNAVVGFGRVPSATVSGGDGGSSGGGGGGGWLGGVVGDVFGSIPGLDSVVSFFGHLDSAFGELWHVIAAIFNPSTYVRVAAGIGGALLLIFGVWFLIRAAA